MKWNAAHNQIPNETKTMTPKMMFNSATNKNIIGFRTKNEKTPINSCMLDENIIVGEIPIKNHNINAIKPKKILITALRRENVFLTP